MIEYFNGLSLPKVNGISFTKEFRSPWFYCLAKVCRFESARLDATAVQPLNPTI